MSIQSNIAIKSNIYVNRTNSQSDKDFLRQVRGYEALRSLNKIRGVMAAWKFTEAQKEELDNGPPNCSLDNSGDKAWGLILENGFPIFVCKCEKTECQGWGVHKGYSECSNYRNFRKVERKQENPIKDENQYIPPDFGLLRYLDEEEKVIYLENVKRSQEKYAPPEILASSSVPEFINNDQPINDTSKPEEVKKQAKEMPSQPEKIFPNTRSRTDTAILVEYKRIDNPSYIVAASIEDKVIVNAGPGTGKTYSVVKRLGYILNNNLADPNNVLVLCYSRSAVGVIKKRIKDEISDGNMSSEALQLFDGIRTFDSFVTYMLVDTELEGTLNHLNYDERIESFILEIEKDKNAFDWLEYLIIDEMQDIVGVRARMAKAILEQIKCGFLLLGDMCQSIYDYQIQDENELNSFRYYKWISMYFGTEAKRFELTNNMRQEEAIAMFTEYMREAILSENIERQTDALNICVDSFKEQSYLGNIRHIERMCNGNSKAILCRNNAEVSIISTEIYAKDINHQVKKRAQHIDLVPWISEILSAYTESRIGIKAFRERALAAGYNNPDAKWALLKTVAKDDSDNVLNVKLLVKTLVGGKDLPVELDLANSDTLTLSTIHRAKGREYEEVLLIPDDYNRSNNTIDEIKAAYVALTRGKEKISFFDIPKKYIKQLESKRWIGTGRSRKNNKIYCSNFDIGFDEDINPYSFVNKNIDDAEARQMYIATLKPGDLLDVWLIERDYRLFHQGVYIGMLSDNIFSELRDAMNKTNHSRNLPNHMSNIYVNNVVTIANTRFNDVIAEPYKKSGLWLGVEISGFAKTDWS